MPAGKILATIVGIFTVAILANQLYASKQSSPIVETFGMNPSMTLVSNPEVMTKQGYVAPQRCGKKLTSDLPDSVFFKNMQLQETVQNNKAFSASYGSYEGSALLGQLNKGNAYGTRAFNEATQVVEPFIGCSQASSKKHAEHISDASTSRLPIGNLSMTDSEGIANVRPASLNMVYSTKMRARCPGTVDFIRGDLAIAPTGILMTPPGRPADSLCTGAMGVLFGMGDSTMETVALKTSDQGSLTTAHSGYNMADLVMQKQKPPPVNINTFATTASAALLANTAMDSSSRTGNNDPNGTVNVITGYSAT